MSSSPPSMRWWGWGVDGHDPELSDQLLALLRDELGDDGRRATPPVALADVALPDRALPAPARAALAGAVGATHVRDGRLDRITHARGRSYPDLVRLRAGDARSAPDAVVLPADAEQVGAVLAACAEHGVAVVPFGGGTSVVGGVEGLRGEHAHAIALDLARLTRVGRVDSRALTATLEAGLRGPDAECALAAHGLTLGHFPQSFEFSTLGGWVATRSAGQASTGYGRIDANVLGLRCVTPRGELAPRALPASAAGPDLRELVVGSEGTLGVICEVTLRVHRAPVERRYEAFALPSLAAGVDALRTLAQRGIAPAVARLSDADETHLSLALAGRAGTLLRGYLRARRLRDPCLMIAGFEGEPGVVGRTRARAARELRAHGAVALGTRPGAAWEHGRFALPYLRDVLLDRALLVDTLETATTWERLEELYRAVRAALAGTLAAGGTPAFVGCHVSHVYASGASLYFTVAARQRAGDELAQWREAKAAAGDAILAAGGTISHHHAVGSDHAPWHAREVGPLGVGLLRACKAEVDPTGILNPGKLVS